MPELKAEKQELGKPVTLFHKLSRGSDASEVMKIGLQSSAILFRRKKKGYRWPGNKGEYIFLRDEPPKEGVVVTVEIPSTRVMVANELLHINNPGAWESSFMSYEEYMQKKGSIATFSPEFLVLGSIPPENIVDIKKV